MYAPVYSVIETFLWNKLKITRNTVTVSIFFFKNEVIIYD